MAGDEMQRPRAHATRGVGTHWHWSRESLRFTTSERDNPDVNYEDRTDLLPPEAVVGASVLEQLRSAADPVGCLNGIAERHVGQETAREVIARFLVKESAEGAPEAALRAERVAAESGFTFGEKLLGPISSGGPDSEQVSSALDQMNLLALVDFIDEAAPSFSRQLAADLAQLAEQIPDLEPIMGALEEAMPLAWSLGLGIAVVLVDSQQNRLG